MIKRLERIVYLTTVFSIILQIGKHFWPSFSFVQSIRVDYLSPTIHLSDIFIITLFLIFLLNRRRNLQKVILNHVKPSILAALFVLFVSSFTALQPWVSLYSLLKLFEFTFFSYVTAILWGESRKNRTEIVEVLGCAVCVVSILALLQFYFQSSIGGIWYYLGERTFNSETINIARFSFFGNLLLRPYATFPHPNVLAYFMFLTLPLLGFQFIYTPYTKRRIFYALVFLIGLSVLFLSFSRIILFTALLPVIFLLYIAGVLRRKRGVIILIVTALVLGLFLLRFSSPSVILSDVHFRLSLISISSDIIRTFPYLGIGLLNFPYYQVLVQKLYSPIYLQPVHNIYLLIILQVGILGFYFFVLFMLKSSRRLLNNIHNSSQIKARNQSILIAFLFVGTLFIGLFDHFLITLQQGQLTAAFLLGIVWGQGRLRD